MTIKGAKTKSKESVTTKSKERKAKEPDPEDSLEDFLFNDGGKDFDAEDSQSEEKV